MDHSDETRFQLTIYRGQPLGAGSVTLEAPSGRNLLKLVDDHKWQSAGGESADVARVVAKWSAAAQQRDDILMFEICESKRLVGQMFLHDMDAEQGQSLIGYHLFAQHDRGRGIGTHALRLLVEYVKDHTPLRELVIITSGDNVSSRRIAEKNGFIFVGPPREDPEGVCLKLKLA